jgi:hypothetical protein
MYLHCWSHHINKTNLSLAYSRFYKCPNLNMGSVLFWSPCITLPSNLRSSKLSLFPSSFPTKFFYTFLISPRHATCPSSHLPWFDHPTNLCWRLLITSFPLCRFLQPSVTSSLLGWNIALSIILIHPQTVLYPQCERLTFMPTKKTGKVTVLPPPFLIRRYTTFCIDTVTLNKRRKKLATCHPHTNPLDWQHKFLHRLHYDDSYKQVLH